MSVEVSTILGNLLSGFGLTVFLFAITLVLALPLGLALSFCSMSRLLPVKYITKGFVWIIRGTPLMLQVIVVSYVPSLVFGIGNKTLADWLSLSVTNLSFVFVCVAFVINYAVYFSEIFRGGIESIPKGQYEAAQALGMTKWQIFTKVVLFQVLRRIMAPMSNEIITLVKDTSLARVLGVGELILSAYSAMSIYAVIWPLFAAGAFYLIFNALLSVLLHFAEKKMSYYKV